MWRIENYSFNELTFYIHSSSTYDSSITYNGLSRIIDQLFLLFPFLLVKTDFIIVHKDIKVFSHVRCITFCLKAKVTFVKLILVKLRQYNSLFHRERKGTLQRI